MAANRRRPAWTSAVLTGLIALALLLAPVASVEAMGCHEHPGHGHSGFAHSSVLTTTSDTSLQGDLYCPDHKGCCSIACGFCIVLASMDNKEAAAIGSLVHFAWGDQTGSGIAFPPTLGPPRLPV
jgi:hypothetical protein